MRPGGIAKPDGSDHQRLQQRGGGNSFIWISGRSIDHERGDGGALPRRDLAKNPIESAGIEVSFQVAGTCFLTEERCTVGVMTK